MTDIHDVLHERGTRYGDFLNQAQIARELKRAIHPCTNWLLLEADQEEALDMFCVKIARIMNGDPNYIDNWRDIAGYATLVADRLEGVKQ